MFSVSRIGKDQELGAVYDRLEHTIVKLLCRILGRQPVTSLEREHLSSRVPGPQISSIIEVIEILCRYAWIQGRTDRFLEENSWNPVK